MPATSVLAESPPAVPAAAGPLPSVSSEVTRPVPVPIVLPRTVWPAGAVHAVVDDDLSAQYERTHESEPVTVTVGVRVRRRRRSCRTPSQCAETAPAFAYAASRRSILLAALAVTVTAEPASAAVAAFV